MPVDILARGIARIVLDAQQKKTIYYAPDLRRRNSTRDLRLPLGEQPANPADTKPRKPAGFRYLDENIPFGWTPPKDDDR
jgi:hypothetical protein